MPLGKYATFGECVGAQKRMGHSDESARKICGAMERDLAGGEVAPITSQVTEEQTQGNYNMSEEPKQDGGEVKLSESEVSDVTQGLTDAKEFLASAGAPQELIDSVNKAFDVIYSKVEAEVPAEAPANPFA
jgi:hypothetical protein